MTVRLITPVQSFSRQLHVLFGILQSQEIGLKEYFRVFCKFTNGCAVRFDGSMERQDGSSSEEPKVL